MFVNFILRHASPILKYRQKIESHQQSIFCRCI